MACKVTKPPVYGYHVHIYYIVGQPSEKAGLALTKEIKTKHPSHINEILVYDDLVGPHPQANYALHIKTSGFTEIVGGLQLANQGLSILIHPETGDDEADHAQRAMWIGTPLSLNMGYFSRS